MPGPYVRRDAAPQRRSGGMRKSRSAAGLRAGRHAAGAASGSKLLGLGSGALSLHTLQTRAANAAPDQPPEELLELPRGPLAPHMFALPPAIKEGRLQWRAQTTRQPEQARSPLHLASDGTLHVSELRKSADGAKPAEGPAQAQGAAADDDAAAEGDDDRPMQAVKAADHTWHYVSKVHASYERPSMRSDVLTLERRFTAAMERVDHPHEMAGKHSAMDRDLMGIQGHVDSLLGGMTDSNIAQHKEGLGLAMFEQKWTDLVLGDLSDQLMVSCLEQGRLLRKIRLRYAGVFARMKELHHICLQSLDEAIRCVAAEREELQDLREAQITAQHHRDMAELEKRMQEECDEYRVKAETAADQVDKMSETLKTLNGIFHTIQNDTDAMHAADLRDAYGQLESVVAQRDQEIARLRAIEREHEKNSVQLTRNTRIIDELKQELADTNRALEQREEMVQDLMRREGERLNEMELALAQARDAEAEREEQMALERQRAQEQASQQVASSSLLCIKCNQSLDALTALDADKEEEERKRRLQCENYRLMLPNLQGERPQRANQWVLTCARAILHSKQLSDALAQRENRRRVRMPEFVYGFFEPTALALAEAPRDLREQMVADADYNRWGFYYGLKALARECVEAKIMFNMLDEKHGEDELVFLLNALRVLKGVALDTLPWGPQVAKAEQYFAERESFDALRDTTFSQNEVVPSIVWADMRHVGAATEVILAKATTDEQMALLRKVSEHAQASTGRLAPEHAMHPDGKTGSCVDAFMWIRVLLHEYREEQAHRRAAVRLMFNTAATGTLTDVVVPNSRKAAKQAAAAAEAGGDGDGGGEGGGDDDDDDGNGSVDLPQFAAMVYTLNQEATVYDVARLYREAFHEGEGEVNYASFSAVAEREQFFSDCLRLPPFLGAAHVTELNSLERAGLGSAVHLQYHVFAEHLDSIGAALAPRAQAQLRRLRRNVDVALHEASRGLAIDGRRPLCAYRRLLWLLLYVRMAGREDTGEVGLRDPVDTASREIQYLQKIVLDCVPLASEKTLRRARRSASVVRIQRAWRARLARDVGVPLPLRWRMHKGYGSGASGLRGRFINVPTSALLATLTAIYTEKVRADEVERRHHRPAWPLLDFVYQFFTMRYGTRELAERHLHDLFVNVRNSADAHPRLRMFAVFTGLLRQVAHPHSASPAGVEFFLRLAVSVSHFSQSLAGGSQNEPLVLFPSARNDQPVKDGLAWSNSDALVKVVRAHFPSLDAHDMSALIQRVQGLEDPKAAGLVDVDRFLLLMMEEFNREIGRRATPLRVALEERTVTGVVNFDAVALSVREVLPDASDADLADLVAAASRRAHAGRGVFEEYRGLPNGQALLAVVTQRVAQSLLPKPARLPVVVQHPAQGAALLHSAWRSYEVCLKTLLRLLEAQVQQLREDEEDGLLDDDDDEEAVRALIKAHHVEHLAATVQAFEHQFEAAQVAASAMRFTVHKAVEASKEVDAAWARLRELFGELAVAMLLARRQGEPIRDNFEKQRGGV